MSLTGHLESAEKFATLSSWWCRKALEEARKTRPTQYVEWLGGAYEVLLWRCKEYVDHLAQSPIEKIFLRSLMLAFLKNEDFLVFMRPFQDTIRDISEFDGMVRGVRKFHGWYRENRGGTVVSEEYLDKEVASGRMPEEERPQIEELLLLYCYFPLDSFWHVALQSEFPGLKVDSGESSVVDMVLWKPLRPDVRLVVECDGFRFHKKHKPFVRDRQRDRALHRLGVQTWRFSGTEINETPHLAAHELFEFLSEKS